MSDHSGDVTPARLLATITRLERERRRVDAEFVRALAEFSVVYPPRSDGKASYAAEEVAIALRWTPGHAQHQLSAANHLVSRLPETVAALAAGTVDLAAAKAVAEITRPVSVRLARRVEATVLAKAADSTLTQTRRRARYHLMRLDPDGAAERRAVRIAARRVEHRVHDDGMGELIVSGPGDRTHTAYQVIDTTARALRRAGDTRTLDALRHDVALDLLLGNDAMRVQTHIYVTVPDTVLLGVDNQPAELHGHGPIDADTARHWAAQSDATWKRLFYNADTNTLLSVGRRRHRPPAALAEHIVVRDKTCTFPGCIRPAHSCELDHTRAFAHGGTTSTTNLGPACARHHHMKHEPGWALDQLTPGHFHWRTPLGQTRHNHPETAPF